jgi:hypothetical protein
VGNTTLSVDDPRYVTLLHTPIPFTTLTYVEFTLQSTSSRRLALHTATQIAILGANFTATGEVRGPPLSGVVEPGVAMERVSHTKLVLLWVLFGALARCLMRGRS